MLRPFVILGLATLGLTACDTTVITPDQETEPEPEAEVETCVDRAGPLDFEAAAGEVDLASVAPGADCSTFTAGSYFGDFTAGDARLGAAVDWDGWVARLDSSGHAMWARRLASEGDSDWTDRVDHVVADASGRSWITGNGGRLDLGEAGVLEGAGPYAMALDELGDIRWVRRLPQWAYNASLQADGNLSLVVADGASVLRLELDGETGNTLTTTTLVHGSASVLAVDDVGDETAVAVCFLGQIAIVDQLVAQSDDTLDGLGRPTCDLALAVIDRTGALSYSRTFTEHGFIPYAARIALSPEGTLALSASFWGRVDMGSGELQASAIAEGMREVVATFDTSGRTISSAAYGEAAFVFPTGIVWSDDGDTMLLGGTLYQGSADFGPSRIGPVEEYLDFQVTVGSGGSPIEAAAAPGLEHIERAEPGAAYWVERQESPVGDAKIQIRREASSAP